MIDDIRFKHTHLCLYLCNKALSEINILSQPCKSKEELDFVNSLQFYRATLQYCFNAEYTKLLENKLSKKYPNNHSASLFLLNNKLLKEVGSDYRETFEENILILEGIRSSTFYENTLILRDKKFSHKDLDDPTPTSIVGLADEEIEIGFEHLKMLYQVLNRSTKHFGITVRDIVPNSDSTTANFIRNFSVYKQFYLKNYMQALEQGYSLNRL